MKSFIITIENHLNSNKDAQECLKSAKSVGQDPMPILFKASTPYTCDQDIIDNDLPTPKNLWGGIGVMGCFVSHMRLWKKCIELDETILVLEHDASFKVKVEDILNGLFEDILFLSRPNTEPRTRSTTTGYFEEGFSGVTDYPYSCIYGTSSYLVKPDTATRLLEEVRTYEPVDRSAVDTVLMKYKSIHVETIYPHLMDFTHTASTSGNPKAWDGYKHGAEE